MTVELGIDTSRIGNRWWDAVLSKPEYGSKPSFTSVKSMKAVIPERIMSLIFTREDSSSISPGYSPARN
jgi:hypothetical protein